MAGGPAAGFSRPPICHHLQVVLGQDHSILAPPAFHPAAKHREAWLKPATPASSTPPGPSSGSWSRSPTRASVKPSSIPPAGLVETYCHLETQFKTVEHRQMLQTESIQGGEAEPLLYMLAQMNLVLHGLESPQITKANFACFCASIPTWTRTRAWSFGGSDAIRYTIGTQSFFSEPTTGFAPA